LAVSVVCRPADRSAADRQHLEALRAGDSAIRKAIDLAERFAAMVRGRDPEALAGWLSGPEGSSASGMRSFALRLRQDEAAVRAGLTFEWSNGQVEGHANRLKVVKRAMYSQAHFDLLRARILQRAA
jgi:transposase